jgi:hypothetical protein
MKALLLSSILFIGIALFGAQFHMNDHTILRNPSSPSSPAGGYDAWWKADAITGVSDGASFTNWVDSGTNSLNLYNTDITIAPVYKTNQLAGYPTVQFSLGTTNNQYFIMPVLTNFTWGEVFIVGRFKNSYYTNVTYSGDFLHAGAFAAGYINTSSGTAGEHITIFGNATAKNWGMPKWSGTVWRVWDYSTQTNSWIGRIDNQQVYADVTNTVSMSTGATNRWVGMTRSTDGTSRYLQGEIAEIILYQEVLSSDDRLSTYQYLTNKYQLTATSPNTTNLLAWYRPQSLTNTTDGSTIENWFDDQNSYDMTQSSSTNRPLYKTNIFNGYAGVAMGPNQSANQAHFVVPTNTFSGVTAGEVMVVFKRFADTPSVSTNAGFWAMSGDAFNGGHVPWTDGNAYETWGLAGQSFGSAIIPNMTNTTIWHVRSASGWMGFAMGANGHEIRYNTITPSWSSTPYYMGRSKGSPTSYYDGWFAEILIWSAVQTPAQRSVTQRYLEQKYGLTF